MAGSLSNWAENRLLEHSVGKAVWTGPQNLELALYTVTPTDADSGVECVGTNYARLDVSSTNNWTYATDGTLTNAVAFSFSNAGNDWGDIEGTALITTVGGVEYIVWYGSFSSPRTVLTGETISFPVNAFVLSLT